MAAASMKIEERMKRNGGGNNGVCRNGIESIGEKRNNVSAKWRWRNVAMAAAMAYGERRHQRNGGEEMVKAKKEHLKWRQQRKRGSGVIGESGENGENQRLRKWQRKWHRKWHGGESENRAWHQRKRNQRLSSIAAAQ
jgi:hypothetical protein